ncbi:MAG: redoxin domain-containing protein [Terriglobia bacterium]
MPSRLVLALAFLIATSALAQGATKLTAAPVAELQPASPEWRSPEVPGQANTTAPAPVGPRSLSEAEADLKQGQLTIWVPRTYVRGTQSLPSAERYYDYSWEGLQREFRADFPNFDLRFQELDLAEFIRAMHSFPPDVNFPDVAFVDNYGELRPLLKQNAVVQMWAQSRLQYRGWWVVFRQARNFAAGESFLLWASQRPHWTPWSVSTNTIDPADVTAVQELSQQAVRDFTNANAQSLESIMDPEAAAFEAFERERIHTLLSVEPLATFGNSRLAFVLLAAVGEGDQSFGLTHFGVFLRNTGTHWKVWFFLRDRPLPDLEQVLQSFDRLGLEEAGAQITPKVMLLAPADHAQLQRFPRPEIEWSTVDAPLATYVVESQFSIRNLGKEFWGPSEIELVSPVSVGPSIRMQAPFGGGEDPHRWRVWAISKAGIVSTSEWRVMNFTNAPKPAQKASAPVEIPGVARVSAPAEVPAVAVDPPCMEWVEAAERGQAMIAPHITIRYNPRAPGARLVSAQSLTLVVASQKGIGFDTVKIPMTRVAGGTWQAEYTPERNFIPGYAIFFFEDEENTIDSHGGQYWDILNCDRGEPDPFSVGAQASTYEGRLLAPGIQRTPHLARALDILRDDLKRYPGHYRQDDYFIWTYELKLGADSPSAYEQVGLELDAFISDHGTDSFAMQQLAAFIGPHQQKLPSSVVQRFRQAVAALPGTETAPQVNSQLDYWLLSSEVNCQKKAQGYLAFAAKYPQSSYTAGAYQAAFDCEVEMKDIAGAESVFEKLAALDRERPDPLLTMAQFYIDQKTKVDRAVKLLDTADTILLKNQARYASDLFHRERGRIEFLRGQGCLLLDDLPRARADLEDAAKAAPDKPNVLCALGQVREKMGDLAPALEAYLSAASAPYQDSAAPLEAYERLFVAQHLGTRDDAEQKLLARIAARAQSAAAEYTPIPLDRPAPKFTFTDLAGKTFDDGAAQGKPTVLSFWSIWCTVCVPELPTLQDFQRQHSGLNFLSVAILAKPEDVKSFLSSHKLNTLRVAIRNDWPPEFGVSELPTTIVMDRFGHIQFVHVGQLSDVAAVLGKDLDALETRN